MLEREFRLLLEAMQVRPMYLELFSQVVRSVWDQQTIDAKKELSSALARVDELSERKNRLVDAMIDKVISRDIYEGRLRPLEDDLAHASRAAQSAAAEHIEIEAVLAYGKRLLS